MYWCRQSHTRFGVRRAGAAALLVLALAGLMFRAAAAEDPAEIHDFNYANKLAHDALGARRYVEAEGYFKRLLELAFDDGTRAMAHGGLSALYRRCGRYDEATYEAQVAWRFQPDGWRLVGLIEAALYRGDVAAARECVRYGEAHPDVIQDEIRGRYLELRAGLSVQVYRLVYRIPPDRWPERRTIALFPPIAETPTQKVLSETVDGAESWMPKTEPVLGNRYLEIVRAPGREVRVVTTVKQRTYSYRGDLAKWRPGPLPDEVKGYLGKTVGFDPLGVIDPDTPLVRGLVAKLRGHTDVETAENIMRWCADNLMNPVTGMRNCDPSDIVLQKGGGHCGHYASGFAALMRGAGIPARMLRGHSCVLTSEIGKVQVVAQHTSPEFYLNGIGWIEYRSAGMPWVVGVGYIARNWFRANEGEAGIPYCVCDGSEAIGPAANGKNTLVFEHLHTFELLEETLDENAW